MEKKQTNSVEQEAIRLRVEHTKISDDLSKKGDLARERLTNPSKLRTVAAYVVGSVVPREMAFDAAVTTQVGPKLIHDSHKLVGTYDQNIKDAAAHKDEHLDEYIALAQTDMRNQPPSPNLPTDAASK